MRKNIFSEIHVSCEQVQFLGQLELRVQKTSCQNRVVRPGKNSFSIIKQNRFHTFWKEITSLIHYFYFKPTCFSLFSPNFYSFFFLPFYLKVHSSSSHVSRLDRFITFVFFVHSVSPMYIFNPSSRKHGVGEVKSSQGCEIVVLWDV